ncbi:MAG: polysaccharide deacetylase family protein [Clostridiales bacterium]|nr:polysaccharide deacetylase family protein [Clostridiales bacterium]
MRENTREFVTINLALFTVLLLLAVFSLGGNGAVQVFTGNQTAIYKAETTEPVVGLMVNVYWGTEYIEPYLELFEQYHVKATFFLGGIWAKDNPDLVTKIVEKGHELGNHGYNHKLPSKNSAETIYSEIEKTDAIISEITGNKSKVYAPPAGDFNESTLKSAAQLGYRTIMWSIDTIDWRDKDSAKIKRRIMDNLQPGSFILMHPTADTLTALKTVLPECVEKGYRFETISELIERM